MWTGALVVVGLLVATLRLILVLSLSVDGHGLKLVLRRLLLAGDFGRCKRLCEAARAPLTDAVAETLREAESKPAGADRAALERAFSSGFRASTARVNATAWVPFLAALSVAAGLALTFAQAAIRPAQAVAAVLAVGALLLTSQRLSRMLEDATAIRDEVVALLLAPREPYRLSIEPEATAVREAEPESARPGEPTKISRESEP